MTVRLLVADDDEDIRAYLEIALSLAGYDVVLARDGVEALELAVASPPDLVMLDIMMPRMDGLEVLRRLREDVRTSHLPVLLVTARVQRDDTLEGLAAGADDYVRKPFDPEVLLARIEASLRRAGQERARNPLTGLPGNERILAELAARLDAGRDLALLYLDLDNFKPFNDHYGFLRGDKALRALADLLVEVVTNRQPEHDAGTVFVGHVGGDDFVLMCPSAHAESIAAQVCAGFDALVPELYDAVDRAAGAIEVADRRGVPQRYNLLTLSVGIATTDHRDFAHPGEVVTAATEMKHYCKARPTVGSAYHFDRRFAEDGVDLEVDLP